MATRSLRRACNSVGVLSLLAVACTSPRRAANEAAAVSIDSILVHDTSRLSQLVETSLSVPEKVQIWDRIDDPRETVRRFLDRLHADSMPHAWGLQADTIFGFFPRPGWEQAVRRSYFWGEALEGRVPVQGIEQLLACEPGVCRSEARRELTAYHRVSAPRTRGLDLGYEMLSPRLSAIPRPKIEAFLAETLRLAGVPIDEARNIKAARREVARSVCDGAFPRIEYSDQIDAVISPITFAFVRAHEFAHFLLRHVRCDGSRPQEPPIPSVFRRELDADCAAANLIVAKVPQGGENVNMAAAQTFYNLNWDSSDYPSSRMRYDSLVLTSCGGG